MTHTERQQHWQRIFQQWRESGLSKKRFCKEHNITLSNFYRWQKLLSPEVSKLSAFVSLSSGTQPLLTSSSVVSVAVGSLRLQVPIDGLGLALVQLKQAGLIDA